MKPDLILANSTPIMAALQKQRHSVPIGKATAWNRDLLPC
jgi:hypothetical protein